MNTDWAGAVKTLILDPLKMASEPGIMDRFADGFIAPGVVNPDPKFSLGWGGPAGDMYASAADMAQFVISLMAADEKSPFPSTTTANTYPLGMSTTRLRRMLTSDYWNFDGKSQYDSPWEIDNIQDYMVVSKAGDVLGFSSITSMVPELQFTTDLNKLQQDTWNPPKHPSGFTQFSGSYNHTSYSYNTDPLITVQILDDRMFIYGKVWNLGMPLGECGYDGTYTAMDGVSRIRFRMIQAKKEMYKQSILDVFGGHIPALSCMLNELIALDGTLLEFSGCDGTKCAKAHIMGLNMDRV